MNAFRGYFSRIKAGKLGQAAFPCPVITLVVCDIPGDDISLVGSGPTFYKDYINLALHALFDFYKIISIKTNNDQCCIFTTFRNCITTSCVYPVPPTTIC